jgi:hypothetical protein
LKHPRIVRICGAPGEVHPPRRQFRDKEQIERD